MHYHAIVVTGAAALLLGGQVLVTGLPIFDYMLNRIYTERNLRSVETHSDQEENCHKARPSKPGTDSNDHDIPLAVNVPAPIPPSNTQTIPAGPAFAVPSGIVSPSPLPSPSPRNKPPPQTTTAPAPDIHLHFQSRRHDEAVEDLPSSVKSQELPTPPSFYNPPQLTMYPCGNLPCLPGFLMLDRGMCVCIGYVTPTSATKLA